jgi:transglutaminase-like putative cysteine protease
MQIRAGYELIFQCPQPTPMILALSIHYSPAADLAKPDLLVVEPAVPIRPYRDGFGNWCSRIVAPQGRVKLTADALINDSGQPGAVLPDARQRELQDLPEDTLVFLLGSRYCETDLLSATAWKHFGSGPTGWQRVQRICDFVHRHVTFGYEHASATKTALQVYHQRKGVCRDFAHLAIAFCRCLNIPARYCTGYLGDIGLPPPYAPMDSRAGSKPISRMAGTPWTRATTFHASVAY